jgi:hypothetical protein
MEKGIYNPERAFIKDAETLFSGREPEKWIWQAGFFQQIKDLSLKEALWKPSGDRHCIWEIVRHVNFWKSFVIATINRQERPDHEAGNWQGVPDTADENAWRKELDHSV